MVRLIGRGSWVVLRQVLRIVPELNPIPIIVILSFHFRLPLINVVGWPLHLLLTLHNHVSETNTFLFLPLEALCIVLS